MVLGALERVLGAVDVVELAVGVVVQHQQTQARSRRSVLAKRIIWMSPFELPAATTGRRPSRLQIRTGFSGPSSKNSIFDLYSRPGCAPDSSNVRPSALPITRSGGMP